MTDDFRQALANCRGAFAATGAFSFFINLLLFVSPIYMLQVYDRVLTSRSESTLVMLTVIAAVMLAVLAALEMMRGRLLVRAGSRLDKVMSGRIFSAVFDRSLKVPGGAPVQALRDMDTVREFATGPGVVTFFDVPWAPLFIAAAFLLHPILGLVSLGGAVIIFALAVANEMITRRSIQSASGEAVAATGFAEASLRNVEVLHAMGMTSALAQRWKASHDRVLALQTTAADRATTLVAISKFVRLFLQSGILGVGAWLALEQEISAGAIIASSIILGRALSPVEQAVGHWKGFLAARTAFQRLNGLLKTTPPAPRAMTLPKPQGALVVDRAIAVPPGGKAPVLKGVGFALEPGEVLAIVGPSAAGKSSLARLLVGVWHCHSGSVRLDGAEMRTWNRDELGPHMGYLPQDIELFDGTVAQNIARFGEVDATAVVAAAVKAGVHEIILHLPDGYDTHIGEGGRSLSGGQRQRIGLARALYKDPSFVVLDEPNSNLDTAGEQALIEAVAGLKECKATTVVISHRLSILACVDKILVLNDGAVELFGSRDDVMARLRPSVVATNAPKAPVAAPPRHQAVSVAQ